MTEDRIPIGDALPSFAIHPLPPEWTPLQCFVLIKALDERGESGWSFRTSEPLNLEELLGALEIQTAVLRQKLVRQWEDEDPGDED